MASEPGKIIAEGDRAGLDFVRWLPHPVESVWDAITQPTELAEWFGQATVDGRKDGLFVMLAGPANVPEVARRTEGTILEWQPPYLLEYEWRQAIVEPSTVRYELSAEDGGTRLHFTHKWLSLQNARGFIPGTHANLDRLAAFLAGDPVPEWGARYAEVAPTYSS